MRRWQTPLSCRGVDYNRMILDIVHNLPKGGGYDRDHPELPVVASLEIAGRWEMLVRHGHPSHCTSATCLRSSRTSRCCCKPTAS